MASTRYDWRSRYSRAAFVFTVGALLFLLLAWWALQADQAGDYSTGEAQYTGLDTTDDQLDSFFGDATSYNTSLELPMASQELVEEYRDRGDCIVRQSGYLGLLGNAWSCVIEGPGWVDLCVVSATSDDTGTLVRVRHLDTSSVVGKAAT